VIIVGKKYLVRQEEPKTISTTSVIWSVIMLGAGFTMQKEVIISKIIQPEEKLLVISADIGQAAQKQAENCWSSLRAGFRSVLFA